MDIPSRSYTPESIPRYISIIHRLVWLSLAQSYCAKENSLLVFRTVHSECNVDEPHFTEYCIMQLDYYQINSPRDKEGYEIIFEICDKQSLCRASL